MDQLIKIWACYYYHQMGFNITHIVPEYNIEKDSDEYFKKNPFKSSSNNREHYEFLRQSLSELDSFDWINAKGIGTVAGFNGLRVLDFDGVQDFSIINTVLSEMGLPSDYEWVVKSGGNRGFHIIFYGDNFEYAGYKRKLKRYYSNTKYRDCFKCIDFIWHNHLILPPSLHKSGNTYSFINVDYPLKRPEYVPNYKIRDTLFKFCYEYGGFNVIKQKVSSYYNTLVIDNPIIINEDEYGYYFNDYPS